MQQFLPGKHFSWKLLSVFNGPLLKWLLLCVKSRCGLILTPEQWRIYIIFGFTAPPQELFNTRQRSCRKVMFSYASVCPRGSPWDHYPLCIGPHFTPPPPTQPQPPPPQTWDMDPPAPGPCRWHLVAITGDLFKLVHLRIPQTCSRLYWQLAAWPPKLWNVSACIKSTPCLKILPICKRGW